MPAIDFDGIAFDEAIEAVAAEFGEQGAGELNGAEPFCLEGVADTLELGFDEAIIEGRIVGNEESILEVGFDFVGDLVEKGGGFELVGVNSGDLGDLGREVAVGVEKLIVGGLGAVGVDADDGKLDNAVGEEIAAGGFDVDDGEGLAVE